MSEAARAESLPNICEPANALFITKYGPMTCAPNAGARKICRGCCDNARSEPPRRSARHPSSTEEGSVFNNSPPDSGGVAPVAPGWSSARPCSVTAQSIRVLSKLRQLLESAELPADQTGTPALFYHFPGTSHRQILQASS